MNDVGNIQTQKNAHKSAQVPTVTLTPINPLKVTFQSNDGSPEQTENFPTAVQKNYAFQEAGGSTYAFYKDGALWSATTPTVNVVDSVGVENNGVDTGTGLPIFPDVTGFLMQ